METLTITDLTPEETEKISAYAEELKSERIPELWTPKVGEKFYTINDSFGICEEIIYDETHLKIRFKNNLNNIFRTPEAAKFEAECRKVAFEINKFARIHGGGNYSENCNLVISLLDGKVTATTAFWNIGNLPYFPDYATAEKAIKEIGKERLLKYWFKVKQEDNNG